MSANYHEHATVTNNGPATNAPLPKETQPLDPPKIVISLSTQAKNISQTSEEPIIIGNKSSKSEAIAPTTHIDPKSPEKSVPSLPPSPPIPPVTVEPIENATASVTIEPPKKINLSYQPYIDLMHNTTIKTTENAPGLMQNPPEYTHMTVFGDRRRWTIDPTKWSEFWTEFCSLTHNNKGANWGISERNNEVMPIISSFVLKFQWNPQGTDDNMKLFGDDFIIEIVRCYQQAIQEILQVRDPNMDLICVVLVQEKNWIDDDKLMTQIRIQFPNCTTNVDVQTRLLRPRAIQLLRECNCIRMLKELPMTDWDNIIDSLVLQEPLLMYKQTMLPNRPQLIIKNLYGLVIPDHILAGIESEVALNKVFNPTNHQHVQKGLVPVNLFGTQVLEYWLPIFLSVNYCDVITGQKNDPTIMAPGTFAGVGGIQTPTHPSPQLSPQPEATGTIDTRKPPVPIETLVANAPPPPIPAGTCTATNQGGLRKGQLCGKPAGPNGRCGIHLMAGVTLPTPVSSPPVGDILTDIIDLLPKDEHTWILIGHYYNAQNERRGGLDPWIQCTEKFKFIRVEEKNEKQCTREDCISKYADIADMIDGFKTVRTIEFKMMQIAKYYNPSAFEEFAKKHGGPLLDKTLSCLDEDVADFVAFRNFDKYAFNEPTKTWYERFGCEWLTNKDKLRVAKEDLIPYLEGWRTDLCQQSNECNDPGLATTIENKLKKLGTLIAKVKKNNYWNNIIKTLEQMMHRGICFTPCRRDKRHLPFVEPVGYINIFVPYRYRVTPGKCTEEEIAELKPIFDLLQDLVGETIQGVNYKYTLKYLADFLQNPEKKPSVALVFVGPQEAGKGTFWEDFFFRLILGDEHYYGTADIMKLVGHFNGAISGKTGVLTDEAKVRIGADWGMVSESLKRNITCPVQDIEKKGFDPIAVASNTRYIFLNNPENPLAFVRNDKRRFCIFKCLGTHCGEKQFWMNFHKNYVTQHMANLFAKFLLSIDLTDFVITSFPDTKFRKEIIDNAVTPVVKFYRECMIKVPGKKVKVAEVSKVYAMWAKDHGYQRYDTSFVKSQIMGQDHEVKPNKGYPVFKELEFKEETLRLYLPQMIQPIMGTGIAQLPRSLQDDIKNGNDDEEILEAR